MERDKKTSDQIRADREKQIPRALYNVTRIVLDEAKGALVKDVDGKEYIDFAGGIGVENVGHCQPQVVGAIKSQAEKCIHNCFHVTMYEPYIELAKRPNRLSPGDFWASCIGLLSGSFHIYYHDNVFIV